MHPFAPRPWLRNGHAMTLYGWGVPRRFPRLPEPTERFFDVAPDTRVLAHCHWQPDAPRRVTLIALHGLNASSHAHYMRGMAAKAFARGMNVVRLNQRNCGNTEHLSAGLFHSGLTHDADFVLKTLESEGFGAVAVAGYSLGGNLALKLAAEYGQAPPPALKAVAAVSPIMEIGLCVSALERGSNWVYQWNFVRDLKRRMRRKAESHPGLYDISRLGRVRTVREFDAMFTAPHFGFASAEDYYFKAAAMRIVDRITLPTLILTAEDDPFVPPDPFRDPKVTGNPHITLELTPHGGHCGFIAAASDDSDGYWAEDRIIEFIETATRT